MHALPYRDPIELMPTNVIQLSPDFLAQLRKIASRRRRSKLWYVVPAMLIGVLLVGALPQTRAFVSSAIPQMTAAPPAAAVVSSPIAEEIGAIPSVKRSIGSAVTHAVSSSLVVDLDSIPATPKKKSSRSR